MESTEKSNGQLSNEIIAMLNDFSRMASAAYVLSCEAEDYCRNKQHGDFFKAALHETPVDRSWFKEASAKWETAAKSRRELFAAALKIAGAMNRAANWSSVAAEQCDANAGMYYLEYMTNKNITAAAGE